MKRIHKTYKISKEGNLEEIELKEFLLIYSFLGLYFNTDIRTHYINEKDYEEYHYLKIENNEVLVLYETVNYKEEENE